MREGEGDHRQGGCNRRGKGVESPAGQLGTDVRSGDPHLLTPHIGTRSPIVGNGCRLGHIALGFGPQMSRLAPIVGNGCRLGQIDKRTGPHVSRLAPIVGNRCRLGHIALGFSAKMALLAPISKDGCRLGHFGSPPGAKRLVWRHPTLGMGAVCAHITRKRYTPAARPQCLYNPQAGRSLKECPACRGKVSFA